MVEVASSVSGGIVGVSGDVSGGAVVVVAAGDGESEGERVGTCGGG